MIRRKERQQADIQVVNKQLDNEHLPNKHTIIINKIINRQLGNK